MNTQRLIFLWFVLLLVGIGHVIHDGCKERVIKATISSIVWKCDSAVTIDRSSENKQNKRVVVTKHGTGRQAECYTHPHMILETLHEELRFTVIYTTSIGEKSISYRIFVDHQLDESLVPNVGAHIYVRTSKWSEDAWPIPSHH